MVVHCIAIIDAAAGDACPVAASFGYKETQPPRYCEDHKMEGVGAMYAEQVQGKRNVKCRNAQCNAPAVWRVPTGRTACSDHKHVGMMLTTKPTCASLDCGKSPQYGAKNSAGTLTARWCKQHKAPDHEHRVFPRTNPRCKAPGCHKPPTYGSPPPPSQPPLTRGLRLYCKEHRQRRHGVHSGSWRRPKGEGPCHSEGKKHVHSGCLW